MKSKDRQLQVYAIPILQRVHTGSLVSGHVLFHGTSLGTSRLRNAIEIEKVVPFTAVM